MEDNYHFELDIHPAFIRKTTLDIYKEYGVKLLSLGIQSFDENVIDISNRSIQNKVSLEKKLKELVPYNFNLHFDFIVGLP
jgi:coproporphyrinogen III oxidase-like Fe-S oxidoreductase